MVATQEETEILICSVSPCDRFTDVEQDGWAHIHISGLTLAWMSRKWLGVEEDSWNTLWFNSDYRSPHWNVIADFDTRDELLRYIRVFLRVVK